MSWMFPWLKKAVPMESYIYDLEYESKKMNQRAKRSELVSQQMKRQCATAQQQNNLAKAEICSINCIRERQRALQYQQLASRIDATVSRLQYAVAHNQVNNVMTHLTSRMPDAFKSMDPLKIEMVMNQFEANFGKIDTGMSVSNDALTRVSGETTYTSAAADLLNECADEQAMEIDDTFARVPRNKVNHLVDPELANDPTAELERRLAKLSA